MTTVTPSRGAAANVAGGLLGIVLGLLTALYPAAVAETKWSYPFEPALHLGVEVLVALSHALVLVGFLALLQAGATGTSRWGRIGMQIALVGFAALTLCELAGAAISGAEADSSAAANLESAFGAASILIAIGSIIAGVAILRAGTFASPHSAAVLVSGIYMIVAVTPAMIAGDTTLTYLVLTVWSLLFVWIGLSQRTAVPVGSGVLG